MQKVLKGLVSELKPIKGMKNLRKTITFSQYPSMTANDDDDGEEQEDVFMGNIAEQYLRKFATMSGADKTFGLQVLHWEEGSKNKGKHYNCW